MCKYIYTLYIDFVNIYWIYKLAHRGDNQETYGAATYEKFTVTALWWQIFLSYRILTHPKMLIHTRTYIWYNNVECTQNRKRWIWQYILSNENNKLMMQPCWCCLMPSFWAAIDKSVLYPFAWVNYVRKNGNDPRIHVTRRIKAWEKSAAFYSLFYFLFWVHMVSAYLNSCTLWYRAYHWKLSQLSES